LTKECHADGHTRSGVVGLVHLWGTLGYWFRRGGVRHNQSALVRRGTDGYSRRGGSRVTETLATGIQMGESPRWHEGRLWMCDWLAGEVLAFDGDGNREVMARVEGMPFSIDWLPDGRLVATTPRGVVAGPDLSPYGATGQPFNEIVVDPVGRVWVDMPGSMPWEESKPGTVTVVLADGSSHQVADDVWFPNGMVVLGKDRSCSPSHTRIG